MDDARNLQYGIGFDTADAETSVDNLGEKVETLEENIGAVEVGAQQMGASAVSACQMGQGAAERFTGAVGDASGGLDDMASSASEAGNAAQKAAGHWNMTAEGLEWVEEAAQAAEAAAESFRDEMDDSGGAAEPVGAILTILVTSLVTPVLPYILAFAAGAMIYVVIEELIPESRSDEHSNVGTVGAALGFALMMLLDVALG